jgi:alpha-mannosidase
VRNPLVGVYVGEAFNGLPDGRPQGAAPTRLAGAQGSLCTVSPANVVIQAVKRAESGKGLIVRLREVAGRSADAVLSLPIGRFKEAWSCNLVEDPQSRLDLFSGSQVRVPIPASGLATVLLK